MKSDVLILFCKYPEPGRVKTRLAASFGDEFTLGLYKAFLGDIMLMTESVNADKIIAVDAPDYITPGDSGFKTGYPVIRQEGPDIGVRMLNAFRHVFNKGYKRAVLIGSDSPDLSASIIEGSFLSLHCADITLGKSTDGGYYLFGLRNEACANEYFMDIHWSTSLVFDETLEKIKTSGRELSLQPEWSDIDDAEELSFFFNKKIKQKETNSQTMKYLLNNKFSFL